MENFVTEEQAKELRLHLISELQKTGFGNVVMEIMESFEEEMDYEGKETISREPLEINTLKYFLNELISLLQNRSSASYPDILKRINKYIGEENNIESIGVELINKESIDLKSLPDYSDLVRRFSELKMELFKQ